MQGDTQNNDSTNREGQAGSPINPASNNIPSGIIATPELPPSPGSPDAADPMNYQAAGQAESKKGHKALWIILILIVLLAAAGAAWYFLLYKKDTTQTAGDLPLKSQTAVQQKSLCFVRLNHLDCTDADGNNRVRYDFLGLKPGENVREMSASADQSVFVARMDDQDPAAAPFRLFDKSLSARQGIMPPAGYSMNTPTLSRDGKQAFMELSKDNDRQVYRYTIATAKFTQLTTQGLNMGPAETADGHILFMHISNSSGSGSSISQWATYIMNGDGSDQHKLPGITVSAGSSDTFFSYDAQSDMVYVYSVGGVNSSVVWYGKVSDLEAGKPASTLPTNIWSSGIVITPLDSGHLLLSGEAADATVISTTSGKQTSTIPHYGLVVGWLKTGSFKRSNPQQEDKYERISNLTIAPPDLQVFLKKQFDESDADCQKGGDPSVEFYMHLDKVVRDTFADTEESCSDGNARFYVKQAAGWQFAFGAQQTPNCDTVNKFTYTKEIIPTCYSGTNEVPNQNP